MSRDSRVFIVLGLAALTVVAVILLVPARSPADSELEEEQVEDAFLTITITSNTDRELAGTFTHGSSHVSFSSQWEGGSRADVAVRVNDLVLEATADLRARTRLLDGHGKGLSVEDKLALQALSKRLEEYLDPYTSELLPHRQLLFRAVLVWSEAPVGWKLERREIRLAE